MGRPPILTMEMVAEAEHLVGILLHKAPVADLLGVSRTTFFRWLRRGAKEARRMAKKDAVINEQEEIFVALWHGVKKGLAAGELKDAQIIANAGQGYWQAAAWRLERAFPERWASNKAEIKRLEKAVEQLGKLGGENANTESAHQEA